MTGTGPGFIAAKLAERDERHRKAGDTRYLVEPNVKEGKGGLREYCIRPLLVFLEDTTITSATRRNS